MKGREEMVWSCVLSSMMTAKIGREHPLSMGSFALKREKNLVKSYLSLCLEKNSVKC